MKIMDESFEDAAAARKWSYKKGTFRKDFSLSPRPFSRELALVEEEEEEEIEEEEEGE